MNIMEFILGFLGGMLGVIILMSLANFLCYLGFQSVINDCEKITGEDLSNLRDIPLRRR